MNGSDGMCSWSRARKSIALSLLVTYPEGPQRWIAVQGVVDMSVSLSEPTRDAAIMLSKFVRLFVKDRRKELINQMDRCGRFPSGCGLKWRSDNHMSHTHTGNSDSRLREASRVDSPDRRRAVSYWRGAVFARSAK